MVNFLHTVLGLLILQIYVSAAPSTNVEEHISKVGESVSKQVEVISSLEEPSKIAKLEEPREVNPEEAKLDSEPLLIEQSKLDDNSTQSLRQKRYYNFFGYGVPPISSNVYPGYNKRDQSAETGVYGLVEDPLEQIQRRLYDIASFVRQPAPPPPPQSHFPFFFPVIYIPQFGCDCNSDDNTTPPSQPDNPQTLTPENNQTDPDPDKRFPVLNDDRQNWGFVTNETEDTEYDEDEFARPISFDPIPPNRPMVRPPPPVDHGSSQGSSADTPQSTTTVRPISSTRRSQQPPPQSRPGSQGRPPSPSGQSTPYPPSFANDIPRNEQPNRCDAAVLSCCHQPYVTYDCFAAQGCPDLTSYGNPCDPLAILQVVDKFRKYYGVRNEN